MRKRVWLLTAAAFVAFFSQVLGLAFQETTSQPASLEGIVVNARTGERLSGVGVFAPPPPSVLPPTTSPPDVATDGSGSFLLERLLPERSAVTFRKPGYVPRAITYSLAAGRRTAGVVVRLNPTGVLSGRVFDATGKPAAAIVVTAFGLIYTSGYSELKNRGEAISNDRGEFRLTELLPDRYTLSFQSQAAQRFGLQVSTREPALLYPGVESFSKAESVEVIGGSETRLKDVTVPSTASLGEVRIHLNVGADEGSKDVLLWFQKATRSERIIDGRLIGSTPVRPAASERFCGDDTPPPCRSSQEIMKVRVNPGADIDRSWWPTAPGTYEAGVQWTSSERGRLFALFRAEREQWVYTGGSPCRYQSSDGRYDQQEGQRSDNHHGMASRTDKSGITDALHNQPDCRCGRKAKHDAKSNRNESLPEHQRGHLAAMGTKCHAKANLRNPQIYEIGESSVDSQRCLKHGYQPKD